MTREVLLDMLKAAGSSVKVTKQVAQPTDGHEMQLMLARGPQEALFFGPVQRLELLDGMVSLHIKEPESTLWVPYETIVGLQVKVGRNSSDRRTGFA